MTLEEASDADAVELEEYYDENDFADDLADDAYESYGDESAPALPTRRKKKKSKKKSSAKSAAPSNDSGGLSKKWIYTLGGIGGVVVVVLIGIVIKVMMSAGEEHAAAMAAPTEFRRFTHKHGGLAADYPDGWLLKSGGGTGGVPNWVSFENEVQEIKISVRGSISGTAISDIASSGGGLPLDLGMDETDDLAPVAGVHQYQKEKISADYDAYEETQPEKIDTGFGEGRVSDFTGKNTLSSEHGVRATLISNQFQYTVICRCPKDRMEEYRPIFRKIISSIGQQ